MGIFLESLTTELIVLIVTSLLLLIAYFNLSFKYWSRKGVPSLQPSFPFGNVKQLALQKICVGESIADIYAQLKKTGAKYGGFYVLTKPIFIPMDPELVKHIMTKDFNSFHDRGVFCDEENDPITGHLFSISGEKWRRLRNTLSPTFTSGKMKMMFQTLVACSDELEKLLTETTKSSEPIDIKDVLARFTTDIIGSCAFGLECNSLQDPNAEFRKKGRVIFELSYWHAILNTCSLIFPRFLMYFKMRISKPEVSDFFFSIVKETIEYREKNNIERKDMMNLLIKLKNNVNLDDDNIAENGNKNEGITLNELVAQCFVFFVAGFETSSTLMTFALFELSQNQEIQDKLRKEINTVLNKHNGKITYEGIVEMTYMDKVINEALRKYPPLPILNRECNADFKIPDSDVTIEKGTAIIISNYGMQKDPEYFPDPEKFDPERFTEEEKLKRHNYIHLPFGEGPRNCIGLRFGLMQSKVGLAVLLKKHRFTLDPKTILPVVFDVTNVILSHKHGIWLQSSDV